ncbi:lysosomal acid glucosylceramidase-like [Eublepharis macularius]|uniref:Glucosylceramidase n=1 Tax=Eublepharis macularius TaxID=481883 RepID=A0AA97JED9_EUBMA|nr:lysosomal acid glucosylceramidase-like [Eublepharis macularius]XP_054836773.1 lysosomal acid glucosylceramidase-like [Eublepharis macularius]
MWVLDAGIWVFSLFLWMVGNTKASQPCIPKFFGSNAIVCVCNATYCDTLDPILLPPEGVYLKYETTKAGRRMELSEGKFQRNHTSCSFMGLEYTFNASDRYQYVKGFGGAHTDAAAINILSLSPAAQEHLLRSYFSDTGIEYNLLRLPIASCDFSTHPYTYDDIQYDFDLKYFSLVEEDTELRIPLLHRIMALSKQPISLVASPWTGPAWLKTNDNIKGKGKLKGKAGDKYHKTWASYLIRFLDEYAKHNITFWAITAQNEPVISLCAKHDFPTMNYSPEEQRDFIILDLGPALANSEHKDVHLVIHDDLRINLPNWAKVVLGNSSAAKYVSGIGVHWYLDTTIPAQLTLGATHDLFPDYFLLYTESCNGFYPWDIKVDPGSWERGVSYSCNIIEDLNHFVTGWIDWNLALDMNGGPNWVKNFVDSPILVDASKDEFYKQPMFYHLAHFSKFIPEGSVRVGLTSNNLFGCMLKTVGFLRRDGAAVVVVLNKCFMDVKFSISDSPVGVIEDVAQAYSIQTYLWRHT